MRIKEETKGCTGEPPGFFFKESSVGLSYIIPSESRQEGCDGYERLPPITIRPKVQNLKDSQDNAIVQQFVDIFKFGKTATASFMAYDDSVCKEYLLSPNQRQEIIESTKCLLSFETAIEGLSKHAGEKGFVCFHYDLTRDKNGQLVLDILPKSEQSIQRSNVQLAIIFKKGVGGTSGMKSEARLLDKNGVLGLLLGEDPKSLLQYYKALDSIEGSQSRVLEEINIIPAEKKMALNTLCCRVDLFLDRSLWDTLTNMEICSLMHASRLIGKEISMLIRERNWTMHTESLRSLVVEARQGYPEHMVEILQHVDTLLNDIIGTLRNRDALDPYTKQQFFLKMFVCCLAVSSSKQKTHNWTPLYMVSTRDCFTSDIVGEDTVCEIFDGRSFLKTRWFIRNTDLPPQFDAVMENLLCHTEGKSIEAMILDGMISTIVQSDEDQIGFKSYLLPLGVTTYNGVYDSNTLDSVESCCDNLHETALQGVLPKECYHATASKKGLLKRTKYFFGSRYLWSREQLKSPHAKIAGGIRHDVPKPQEWMRELVEQPMISAKVVPDGFVNAIALNMYHDGSEGIQSHYDDSRRFHQPIYSLRLFSDSRLSFGTQLYGFTNGLFFIPMPRGCITVMENLGFAANGVKHCVRPIDMTGKSAAMILRKINEDALKTAEELFWNDIIEKLEHLSLIPASPDRLIWNPLFDDSDLSLNDVSSTLRKGMKKERDQVAEGKSIKAVVHAMLKYVIRQEKKEAQNKRKILYIISGMTKRICTAERLGMDISQQNNCEIFNIVDDVISFCEYPTHLRGSKRKRKQ